MLIGFIAINQREDEDGRIYNLGYIFHPDYHGQGYATEGCRSAMNFIFSQLGADAILTGTHPNNKLSIRLRKKLGLKEIGRGKLAISKRD